MGGRRVIRGFGLGQGSVGVGRVRVCSGGRRVRSIRLLDVEAGMRMGKRVERHVRAGGVGVWLETSGVIMEFG